jgi:hypothetical protein
MESEYWHPSRVNETTIDLALLRWAKARAQWIYPSDTCQITRASSANASARRAVSRTSVPRS